MTQTMTSWHTNYVTLEKLGMLWSDSTSRHMTQTMTVMGHKLMSHWRSRGCFGLTTSRHMTQTMTSLVHKHMSHWAETGDAFGLIIGLCTMTQIVTSCHRHHATLNKAVDALMIRLYT